MIYRTINIPVFLEIGEGILEDFDGILKKHNLSFSRPLILTGEKSSKVLAGFDFFNRFEKLFIRENDLETLLGIKSAIYGKGYDVLIACGGGRVIDSGKFLSLETSLPLVAIPTILSSDSVSSPISILKDNHGTRSMGTVMPMGVLIDVQIIRTSPEIYLKAGLGDLMSNLSSAYDWELAHKRGFERIDNFSRMLALLPAQRILLKTDGYKGLKDEELLADLAEGLVLSGISMAIAGSSRPASGSEHNISHSLDRILGQQKKLHGLQVGLATILTLILQGNSEQADVLSQLYQKTGFPLNLKELEISCEDFEKALEIAPGLRDRYTVLNEIPIEELKEVARARLCK